jgi:hypothetical protein
LEGRKMKRIIAICVTVVLFGSGYAGADGTWTQLDYPGARATYATGMSGSSIVGLYVDNSSVIHGFLYSGAS